MFSLTEGAKGILNYWQAIVSLRHLASSVCTGCLGAPSDSFIIITSLVYCLATPRLFPLNPSRPIETHTRIPVDIRFHVGRVVHVPPRRILCPLNPPQHDIVRHQVSFSYFLGTGITLDMSL